MMTNSSPQTPYQIGLFTPPEPARRSRTTAPKVHPFTEQQDQIVKEFIDNLQRTDLRWIMPWDSTRPSPLNAYTSRPYTATNMMTLQILGSLRGYRDSLWAGLGQWNYLKCRVRKGERAAYILLPLTPRSDDPRSTIEEYVPDTYRISAQPRKRGFRLAAVFNIDQVDGVFCRMGDLFEQPPVERRTSADQFVAAQNANIEFGYASACYQPGADRIRMPAAGQFRPTPYQSSTEAFYSTLFHELVHWTGHPDRCQRNLAANTEPDYALEELVAEIGASFICCEVGVSDRLREDHIAYVQSWIRALQDRPDCLLEASRLAAQATAYMRQRATGQPNARRTNAPPARAAAARPRQHYEAA